MFVLRRNSAYGFAKNFNDPVSGGSIRLNCACLWPKVPAPLLS
jgi:hypothetical protein